jgi:hypothetical protein
MPNKPTPNNPHFQCGDTKPLLMSSSLIAIINELFDSIGNISNQCLDRLPSSTHLCHSIVFIAIPLLSLPFHCVHYLLKH